MPNPGAMWCFKLAFNGKSQPQALDVHVVYPESERFYSKIVSYGPEKGFGFIHCDETFEKYG